MKTTMLQSQVINDLLEDNWKEHTMLTIAFGTLVLCKYDKISIFYSNGAMNLYAQVGQQVFIPSIHLN